MSADRIAMELQPVVNLVLDQYKLDQDGIHGVAHWGRVLENGLRLCRQNPSADERVVALFAVLHDACRECDGHDRRHGVRAATLAMDNQTLLGINADQADRLCEAIHAHGAGSTISGDDAMTCWDADRLDLGRVGITPDPERLCLQVSRDWQLIAWASRRAQANVMPPFARRWLAEYRQYRHRQNVDLFFSYSG